MNSRYKLSMANQIDVSDWHDVEIDSLSIKEWTQRRVWINSNISGFWTFSSRYNWVLQFSNEEDAVFYKMVWT